MKQTIAVPVPKGVKYVSAVILERDRRYSIENYLKEEAGICPGGRQAPAWVIDRKDWPYKGFGGFWRKKWRWDKDGNRECSSYILVVENKPYEENAVFAHEALGHGGFEEHISAEEKDITFALSEAFARTGEILLREDRSAYMSPSETVYPAETKELTEAASTILLHLGKRGTIAFFYALAPPKVREEQAASFINELAKDTALLQAFGILAARYGGENIGRQVHQPRLQVLRAALHVRDEMVQHSSNCTEEKLMRAYLSREFSLGDAFAQFYLREARPSSFEELIFEKTVLPDTKVYAIDRASALKWVGAHRGGTLPCYEAGMNILQSLARTSESWKDLDGEKRSPQSLHRYLVRRREERKDVKHI